MLSLREKPLLLPTERWRGVDCTPRNLLFVIVALNEGMKGVLHLFPFVGTS